MENELIKLSWLNWVTSHSSWEASKIKHSRLLEKSPEWRFD